MNYKIIFIDIDGTLRNDKKIISEKTIEILSKLKELGVIVVITSGRPLGYTLEISRIAQASNYIIASNGAEIYDEKDNVFIYSSSLLNKTIEKLIALAEKKNLSVRLHTENPKIKYIDYTKNFNYIKTRIAQVIFVSSDIKSLLEARSIVNTYPDVEVKNQAKYLLDFSLPKPSFPFLDISNKEVTKGNAVKILCKYLNIDLKDSVAIGDGENDISMFNIVGLSIAMDNASIDIKNKVNLITKDNNHDGIYYALKDIYKI